MLSILFWKLSINCGSKTFGIIPRKKYVENMWQKISWKCKKEEICLVNCKNKTVEDLVYQTTVT